MAIQYAGGTIVSTTFTGTAKSDIQTALNTQLKNAGWTAISGDGTSDVILESATTPTASNLIRVRLRSTNLTNCACINMQNAAGTRVSQNYFLLPAAAKTFRIIANKYQFFCFTPGTSAAREFVAMGVPYIPAFLQGIITGDFGWIQGNSQGDTNTTVSQTFRTSLGAAGVSSSQNYHSGLVNNSVMDTGVVSSGIDSGGGMRLTVPLPAVNNNSTPTASGFRWHDDSLMLSDPLICWGLTSAVSDEGKIRGQLWDAMVISDAFAGDSTLSSVDSHNWWAITNNNSGTATLLKGTLFVATS